MSESLLVLAGLKQELDSIDSSSKEKECDGCGRTVMVTPDTERQVELDREKGNKPKVVCSRCLSGVRRAG